MRTSPAHTRPDAVGCRSLLLGARTAPGPRAFTVVEIIVALAVFGLLCGTILWLLGFGSRSSQGLAARMSLQQASRKALVRLLREVQEGMEVLSPRPGTTLAHALVRDKVSQVRWFVQHPIEDGTFELWRYVGDPGLPTGKRGELLLGNVKRLRFTCTSEGALQVNLTLSEQGQESSLLTTIRLRNLPSAEMLW